MYKHSLFCGQNYWRHQIGIWEFVQLNSIINMVLESSSSLLFYKIGAPRNFAEFTRKRLRSVTLIKKNQMQVLSCEFCKIFKNPFWQNTSGRLLLDFFSCTQLFFATQWICFITAFERDEYHELYFAKQTT